MQASKDVISDAIYREREAERFLHWFFQLIHLANQPVRLSIEKIKAASPCSATVQEFRFETVTFPSEGQQFNPVIEKSSISLCHSRLDRWHCHDTDLKWEASLLSADKNNDQKCHRRDTRLPRPWARRSSQKQLCVTYQQQKHWAPPKKETSTFM